MRIIDRYIIKETVGPLVLGLSIFTFVLFIGRMVELTELIIVKGVDLSSVLLLFLNVLPSLLILTIPMSMLLGTLVAFGRLSADSEITALKATGISLYRMWLPCLGVAFICYLITFYLFIYAVPQSLYGFRQAFVEIISKSATAAFHEGVFNSALKDFVIYTQKVDDRQKKLEGIFIADQREDKLFRIINAQEGEIFTDPAANQLIINLRNGSIHQFNPRRPEKYQIINFERLHFAKDLTEILPPIKRIRKTDREMTIEELLEKIEEGEQFNEPRWNYRVELHKRFAVPALCLVLVLLGPPLGIQARRSGRMTGFTISLVIIFLYYLLITIGEALGDKGKIPPFIAMWGPNFILGTMGIYILITTAREAPFKPLLLVMDLLRRLNRRLNPLVDKEQEEDRP